MPPFELLVMRSIVVSANVRVWYLMDTGTVSMSNGSSAFINVLFAAPIQKITVYIELLLRFDEINRLSRPMELVDGHFRFGAAMFYFLRSCLVNDIIWSTDRLSSLHVHVYVCICTSAFFNLHGNLYSMIIAHLRFF